ncbi:MAG: hypothetical protein NUW09_03215 [Deltaproteobacteria bacterium]|nr:hypothetical protein [Deltaproteobacteria bacterium]
METSNGNLTSAGLKALSLAFCITIAALSGCSNKKEGTAPETQAPAAQLAPAPEQAATGAQAPAGQPMTGAPAAQPAMPSDHPKIDKAADVKAQHGGSKQEKELKLSDEVKVKWKEVKLDVTDSSAKSPESVTIKVGGSVNIGKNGATLKVVAFVPDYAMSDNNIVSRSNDLKNPAVLLELLEGGKVVVRGWVFNKFPDFNSFNSAKFKVALVQPAAAEPKAQQ